MPVPVTPINRQFHAVRAELGVQRRNQPPALRVNRARAVEMVVMFRNLKHALSRHILPAQDILKKGDHICALFGSSERHQQKCVIAIVHMDLFVSNPVVSNP